MEWKNFLSKTKPALMKNRDRFKQTLLFQKTDRLPFFEEGIRSDVIRAWKKQGLSSRSYLEQHYPSDPRDEIQIDLDPYPDIQHRMIPANQLMNYFNPARRRRWPWNWRHQVAAWKRNDHVRIMRVHRGFFLAMGVHSWDRFDEVISLTLEEPDYVREYLEHYSLFCAEIISRVIKDVSIDAALFNEPIGGNEGPLLSPDIYGSLVLPTYRVVFERLKAHGIKIFIFRTYANTAQLLPCLMEFGFNCLWACEPDIQAMDYPAIRRRYGKKLSLIGGINIDCLRSTRDKIRIELEKKVPELVSDGGYIPLADGRIRADISYENYQYYREYLSKLTNLKDTRRAKE